MTLAKQLHPDMSNATVVNRSTVGILRQSESGYEALAPARENAGLPHEAVAAVMNGMPRHAAKAGAAALRETVGQKDPIMASLGGGLVVAGVGNMQDRSHIEPAQTSVGPSKKGGPEGHSV